MKRNHRKTGFFLSFHPPISCHPFSVSLINLYLFKAISLTASLFFFRKTLMTFKQLHTFTLGSCPLICRPLSNVGLGFRALLKGTSVVKMEEVHMLLFHFRHPNLYLSLPRPSHKLASLTFSPPLPQCLCFSWHLNDNEGLEQLHIGKALPTPLNQ